MEQRLQVKLQLPQEHSPRELGRWIAVVEGLEVEPGGRLELVVGFEPHLLLQPASYACLSATEEEDALAAQA